MFLIGYRLVFGELCTLLNVRVDPDADYVEDDEAREKLETLLLNSVKNTKLHIKALPNELYYLGLTPDICNREIPEVITTREMADKIASMTILFRREIKKIGIFRLLQKNTTRFPEPYVVQVPN